MFRAGKRLFSYPPSTTCGFYLYAWPQDIKKLEDAAENLNDEEKAIKRQRVELVGSLEAPEQPPAQASN